MLSIFKLLKSSVTRSKAIYKTLTFMFILLTGSICIVLLYDNLIADYSVYFRIIHLILFIFFMSFGGIMWGILRQIEKLYQNQENSASLNKLAAFISLLEVMAILFLSGLLYGLIARLVGGTPLLG